MDCPACCPYNVYQLMRQCMCLVPTLNIFVFLQYSILTIQHLKSCCISIKYGITLRNTFNFLLKLLCRRTAFVKLSQ